MATSAPLPIRFVQSATTVAQLPPTRGEVAIVGRSNVGKSSLVNALANRENLARVSKTPGRTQLLNLFDLGEGYTLLDLPGYGYAKVPAAVRSTWPAMIEGYLLNRERLRTVVALVDAEVGPTALDRSTIEWLRAEDLHVQVVATKADKVKRSAHVRRRAELAAGCGLTADEVVWVSAAAHQNIDELRRLLLRWVRPRGHEDLPAGADDGADDGWDPAGPPPSPSPVPGAGPAPAVPAVDDDDDDEWETTRIGDPSPAPRRPH